MGRINIAITRDQPGYINSLMVRMWDGAGWDRYCAISDADNKASQLQMFKSLIQMIEEACGVKSTPKEELADDAD